MDVLFVESLYSCKNVCEQYEFKFPGGTSPYMRGAKRCTFCQIYLDVPKEVFNCPCCHFRLRKTPRCSKLKNKFIGKKRVG